MVGFRWNSGVVPGGFCRKWPDFIEFPADFLIFLENSRNYRDFRGFLEISGDFIVFYCFCIGFGLILFDFVLISY